MSDDIQVDFLSTKDIPSIADAFNSIGWDKPVALFEQYLKEAASGSRVVWIARINGKVAGYITLRWKSFYQPFKDQNIPEIIDLNVLPSFRKRRIASKLLNTAENEAATKSNIVGLGVGLYAGQDGGYGPAQMLYVKRGYIPDGKGISYNSQPVIPGKSYPIDDNLLLWFTKKLQ